MILTNKYLIKKRKWRKKEQFKEYLNTQRMIAYL